MRNRGTIHWSSAVVLIVATAMITLAAEFQFVNLLPQTGDQNAIIQMKQLKGLLPVSNVATVTPNDSTDLPNAARQIYCTGAGTVKVNLLSGGTTTITVTANSFTVLYISRVWATGTTATGISAYW